MALIGNYVIYVVMACAVAGAVASIFDDEKGLGKEFKEGIYSIGYIFLPVAGIMASIPYLSYFIKIAFGPIFTWVGADPSIAATTFIAVDMGGYQLAETLALTKESWIMAMTTGYMAGATIVFSIPVGLAMIEKKDHKYMALGVMAGILSIPIGVFVSCSLLAITSPTIYSQANSTDPYQLALTFSTIFTNLIPLIVVVLTIALGLRFLPDLMIKSFLWFGRIMNACITLVLVFSIVEYFTFDKVMQGGGFFSYIFGSWGFDPIIADEKDQFRALEIAGYIGIMLSGAFPMVYLIQKYLAKPMDTLGKKIGIESAGAAGILASIANILAMFRLIKDMSPKDKVLNIAFAVCAAFMFGDHLAFTANFQPNLILAILSGKFIGGICGFLLAYWLSVPKALQLEKSVHEGEKE
ncbi:ethanolamine utilization protein EutH [Candidatus Uabimicrobium sp. HlEnr_7]|uniref:ethanolamine utilization protein EutH n=1 Tax=Candidatus Uabimicrobium helgolandensis TaxID=3095367 RepID=UPI003555C7A7